MWTRDTRRQHSRDHLRYPTSLTDAEWLIIAAYLPAGTQRGRPRRWSWRQLFDAILFVLRTGAPWRCLPLGFPPWQTAYCWFARLRDEGFFQHLNHALVLTDRTQQGREAAPSAAVIDSQSVKTTEAGGPRGYDAGKKIMGRKRHAMVDTEGRVLELLVHPADVQDRDGAVPLLQQSRRRHPFVERAFADSAYNADRVADATSIDIEIVRKIAAQIGFVVHPRRWVVERTPASARAGSLPGSVATDASPSACPREGGGLRGHHRLRYRLPLRRRRHAPRQTNGPTKMTFETDSK